MGGMCECGGGAQILANGESNGGKITSARVALTLSVQHNSDKDGWVDAETNWTSAERGR